MIKEYIGFILIVGGIFDSWKYIWQAQAIRKAQTARGNSRKFINAAIFQDLIKLIYGIVIMDIFIVISSLLALITMCYCWWCIYIFYPYRMRGCWNFKKPNILLYIVNSLLPNRIRKRL